MTNGFIGWCIEGRDLILGRTHTTPPTPGEIVTRARRVVALAHLFPTEAATLYGAPPTTDIPLSDHKRLS